MAGVLKFGAVVLVFEGFTSWCCILSVWIALQPYVLARFVFYYVICGYTFIWLQIVWFHTWFYFRIRALCLWLRGEGFLYCCIYYFVGRRHLDTCSISLSSYSVLCGHGFICFENITGLGVRTVLALQMINSLVL